MHRLLFTLFIPVWIALTVNACAHQKEAVVTAKSALEAVDTVGAPAYELTRIACSAAQWHVVRGDGAVDQKQAKVAEIREKCEPVYQAFEKLVIYKNAAHRAIEVGASLVDVAIKVTEAQDQMKAALKAADDLRRQIVPRETEN